MRAADSLRSEHLFRWQELAELALRGLRSTYGGESNRLPHTMSWDGISARPVGFNVRYALISLLGLGKSQVLELETSSLIKDLWSRVAGNRSAIDNSAGDQGLALWAQAVIGASDPFLSGHALKVFRKQRESLDSVNLAWVMLGADHTLLADSDAAAEELVQLAKDDLLKLYNHTSSLFYRHAKHGPLAGISRRVPCFANQIYPVMALAVHTRRTGDAESGDVGRRVANHLCRLQGPLGQWWWLYDAQDGPVIEGYPVFSVHQDGMAPMALVETEMAGGRSYKNEIERGLSWIYGANELAAGMVLNDPGLVLRDIHKQGVGRVRRALLSAAWCRGKRGSKRRQQGTQNFVINRECRPYHLGWILYAASLIAAAQDAPVRTLEGSGQCS